MGTSKSYITPATEQRKNIKLAINSLVKNPDNKLALIKIVNNLYKTIAKETTSSKKYVEKIERVYKILSSLAHISGGVSGPGINVNSEDDVELIIDPSKYKNTKEMFEALLVDKNSFCIDDSIFADALTDTLKNLNLIKMEELDNLSIEIFIKELIANLGSEIFAAKYSEIIIGKFDDVDKGMKLCADICNYVYDSISIKIKDKNICDIIVKKKLFEFMNKTFDDAEGLAGE